MKCCRLTDVHDVHGNLGIDTKACAQHVTTHPQRGAAAAVGVEGNMITVSAEHSLRAGGGVYRAVSDGNAAVLETMVSLK